MDCCCHFIFIRILITLVIHIFSGKHDEMIYVISIDSMWRFINTIKHFNMVLWMCIFVVFTCVFYYWQYKFDRFKLCLTLFFQVFYKAKSVTVILIVICSGVNWIKIRATNKHASFARYWFFFSFWVAWVFFSFYFISALRYSFGLFSLEFFSSIAGFSLVLFHVPFHLRLLICIEIGTVNYKLLFCIVQKKNSCVFETTALPAYKVTDENLKSKLIV